MRAAETSAPSSPPSTRQDWPFWWARVGWLTGLSVAAVVAVNAAGIWGIAVARRGVVDQSARVFKLQVDAVARSIESVLSSTRADLAFLTGSPAVFTLESALASRDPRQARWGRLGAEGALLLFLRGHPEVMHLGVLSARGHPLVEAGRRGGVPVLWRSSPASAPRSTEASLTARFAFAPAGGGSEAARLEVTLEAAALLAHATIGTGAQRACELHDANGSRLITTHEPGIAQSDAAGPGWMRAEALVRAEGWSAPSPWVLTCAQREEAAVALLEPVVRRYWMTLGLNLAVMALALMLGSFAIQQARRRERLEAAAREESRVREVERQLFHSERLSTVGRLAAGMAHEINNPLEGMSNYLGLAEEALSRGDAGPARRHLARVREGLERAAGVVRQVLQHADPATAPRTPLDLNAAILQAVEFVSSRREFSGIRFDLHLAEPAPHAQGSQVMLGQLFLNLLLNACEAQPAGGEVIVSTRNAAGSVYVEIADRGPGVPASEAVRIFEPFYSTKSSTGLGLSICHSIVRQHGGEIRVADQPGGGALFSLKLPAAVEGGGP